MFVNNKQRNVVESLRTLTKWYSFRPTGGRTFQLQSSVKKGRIVTSGVGRNGVVVVKRLWRDGKGRKEFLPMRPKTPGPKYLKRLPMRYAKVFSRSAYDVDRDQRYTSFYANVGKRGNPDERSLRDKDRVSEKKKKKKTFLPKLNKRRRKALSWTGGGRKLFGGVRKMDFAGMSKRIDQMTRERERNKKENAKRVKMEKQLREIEEANKEEEHDVKLSDEELVRSLKSFKFGKHNNEYRKYSFMDQENDLLMYNNYIQSTINRARRFSLIKKVANFLPYEVEEKQQFYSFYVDDDRSETSDVHNAVLMRNKKRRNAAVFAEDNEIMKRLHGTI